ncbi:TPA: hypothetical protein L9S71_005135 [Klebsiella pneumoniae]|nr:MULTISPECIES: hypothetical protein [Klebsiella]HBR2115656.1 hypothetical protein [Klebsiella quasipneumoniae subsp. similipneumoniae]EIV6806552.1 hypothetical protein [Klebsiella pneumoniae]EKL4052844.1 hypothetical protein [Klebsiella pneumoniae]EKU2186640.1 hypothetical protein [Klebsiella pneumoniae]EKX6545126.1 hypothetical protein [Klebsiella pneumoniae]
MSAAGKTKKYDVVPTSVRRMTKLHAPDGDIKFTSLMKLIYAYIWTFQENDKRGNKDPIHTNTDVIAWEMGVSEKAVIAALQALDAAKVVIKHTIKVRGNVKSSNYVAVPPTSVVALGETPPKPGNEKKKSKKNEDKQEDGKSEMQAEQQEPQAKQAATAAIPPADEPANQNPGAESDDERTDGNNAGTDDDHTVNQNDDTDPLFPPKKPAPEETAGRVIAPLDDLRYWSDIGYEGMDDYGVMWGVSGDDLDNLIREHLKIREAEAEKNFKSQRTH